MSLKPNRFIIENQTLIDGQWVGSDNGGSYEVFNPSTGLPLGRVPDQGEAETIKAVHAAEKAFKTWQWSQPKARSDILKKWFALMTEHAEDLAQLITLENGKPLVDARGEQAFSSSFLEWFSAEAMRNYGDTIPATIPGVRNVTIRQPVGVVGIITPWNFPSAMITRKVAAAVAAGCTCVIKTAPQTPFSALALAKLAEEAGLPKGVINVITTQDSPTVGRILATHPAIRKLSFTGSTAVGKLLANQASGTLKKLSLELGGNAAFIVFDDADVEKAVAGAIICKFRSSGQTCVCANRIYVQSGVYEEFTQKLAKAVQEFVIGDGMDVKTTHGPLIDGRAVDKVERHVQDAIERGAECLVGGKRGKGYFFEPTVLINVSNDAAVTREETFGPLAAIIRFDTEDEVIELANDSETGLAGYFFSRDVGRVWRIAEALQVGMVGANTGFMSQACCPFGGVKESGCGREGSKYGLDDYTEIKFICMGM